MDRPEAGQWLRLEHLTVNPAMPVEPPILAP